MTGGADVGRRGRLERIAPAGALGFLACLVIGAVILGRSPPASHAPVEDIGRYFADHRSGVLYNTSFAVFGAFTFYPWFLAGLWRAIRRADGDGDGGVLGMVAVFAGVGLLGPLLLQAAGWGAAALEAGPSRDPSLAAGLMDLGNMGFLLFPMPASALIAATSLAAPPGMLLPAWLARAGLPLAAVLAAGGLVGFSPQALFVLFSLWLVAVAVLLMRRE